MKQPELDLRDTERLGALARRLRVTPRQLIVAAARCAGDDEIASADRQRILEQARAPTAAARQSAALLLTPPAHFAQDELASAIASVFPASAMTGD